MDVLKPKTPFRQQCGLIIFPRNADMSIARRAVYFENNWTWLTDRNVASGVQAWDSHHSISGCGCCCSLLSLKYRTLHPDMRHVTTTLANVRIVIQITPLEKCSNLNQKRESIVIERGNRVNVLQQKKTFLEYQKFNLAYQEGKVGTLICVLVEEKL